MSFSHLHQYQQKLAQLGQRQLLLLAGKPAWQTEQIQQIIQLCQGDWITISSVSLMQFYLIMLFAY